MNIYLDIDGTLIHEDLERAGEPAEGLADFIRALFPRSSDPHTHTTYPYSVYWLTTHCMDGDPIHARKLMKASVPAELHGDIDRIKPTRWSVMKTEAIDFTKEFIWFDNDVMAIERERCGEFSVAQQMAQETGMPFHVVRNEKDVKYAAHCLGDIIKALWQTLLSSPQTPPKCSWRMNG
ncbi:MAG: hypothetical protein KBD24_00190 [Candidatus Pacebacteria bacterium]|nr:hypothetical protein [Candidatus Paceibacterota bacterium]